MWDTKAIGRGLALPDLWLMSVQEKTRSDILLPLLEIAWPRAIARLERELKRLLPGLAADPVLAARVGAFSGGLRYAIDEEDGHVLVFNDSDPELERALHYGTRALPAVRPCHLVVGYLSESKALSEIIFTTLNR
jgi:hypothetical protein